MTTQLVLQFKAAGGPASFDRLLKFEDMLCSVLGQIAKVDGHDSGSGEINIFILTDKPIAAFNLVKQIDKSLRPHGEMKAAYRQFDREDYVCLWPPTLSKFEIN